MKSEVHKLLPFIKGKQLILVMQQKILKLERLFCSFLKSIDIYRYKWSDMTTWNVKLSLQFLNRNYSISQLKF